jgi:sigma-B regulation protein RsbU (phosphoserine phosphatase)
MGLTLAAKVRELVAGTAARTHLEGELAAAREIQLGMLPDPELAPARPDCQLKAYLNPAKEVGGDLYDYFTAPGDRQAVVIGDVSGKGVPAALFMAMTSTLTRQAIAAGLPPAEILTQVNERLAERNPSSMFVTLFIGLIDPDSGRFDYANAGHCFPVVCGPDGSGRLLDGKSGPMVGVISGIDYRGFSAIINKDELCFLYTDGVTEAQNARGEFFGQVRLEEVLEAAALNTALPSPTEALEAVKREVALFQGEAPQADDITILAFARS